MENGRGLQQSWEYCTTQPLEKDRFEANGSTLRVNLSSGEIFQADEYRLIGETSVTFYLDGKVQARTPISNVWHFVA